MNNLQKEEQANYNSENDNIILTKYLVSKIINNLLLEIKLKKRKPIEILDLSRAIMALKIFKGNNYLSFIKEGNRILNNLFLHCFGERKDLIWICNIVNNNSIANFYVRNNFKDENFEEKEDIEITDNLVIFTSNPNLIEIFKNEESIAILMYIALAMKVSFYQLWNYVKNNTDGDPLMKVSHTICVLVNNNEQNH
ncbi:hypothetical protein ABK040_014894 [Willaertia magna]